MVYDIGTKQTTVLDTDVDATGSPYVGDDVAIDGTGRRVLFTVLSPRDTAGRQAINLYRFDLQTGDIELLSHRADGSRSAGRALWIQLSAAGTVATFTSDATDLVAGGPVSGNDNVYAVNLLTKQAYWISQGNLGAEPDNLSGTSAALDGFDAVFTSYADNLVAGDTNGVSDVFVRRLAVLPDLRVDAPTVAADALTPRVALVPVTLSAPVSQPTEVQWHLSDGTDRAGVDYLGPSSGTLTIAAGAQSAFIPVTVAAGAHAGTFTVSIEAPNGPKVGTSSATLTVS
jgi:hypothetical protein